MDIMRPATYRTDTWPKVIEPLRSMSPPALLKLAARAGIKISSQEPKDIIEQLLPHGGFLLVELGLTNSPHLINGTIFSVGGLEYVINHEGARILQAKKGTAHLEIIGGGKSKKFSYNELVKSLVKSPDFDQLKPR